MSEKAFDWAARVGLLGALLAWGMLALGVGGPIAFVVLACALIGNMLFVWYQIRQRVLGKDYPDGKDLLLSCSLPLMAMIGVSALTIKYFSVLVGAH